MITEELLADLLAEHAERIPVPDAGVDALLARAPEVERRSLLHRLPRPPARALAIAAAVCVVAGAGLALGVGHGPHHTNFERAAGPVEAPPTTRVVTNGPANARQRVGGASSTGRFAPYALNPSAGVPATKPSHSTNDAVTAPTDTARVIRTATVDLHIVRHSFGTVVARVTTVAASEGGFIANADTNEAAATPSGSMTVRVPSPRFNDTIGKLRALGTVESQTTHGTDVTGQYVDLNARLKAATATRDAYLSILSGATNIGDVLAVQDRIQGVQTQIDQLQGQINSLDNQTTYATITLSVTEPPPKAKPVVKPRHKSGLEVAWDNARNGFARRVEGLISHSGSALVILLSLVALAFALRLLVPRARRLFV